MENVYRKMLFPAVVVGNYKSQYNRQNHLCSVIFFFDSTNSTADIVISYYVNILKTKIVLKSINCLRFGIF